MPHARLIATVLTLAAFSGAAAAGQTATPSDEVLSVLTGGPGVAVTGRYTVSADVPRGFPSVFLPTGVEVQGTAESDQFSVVVAYAASDADVALVTDVRRLGPAGWTPALIFANSGPLIVGSPVAFCREAETVYVGTVPAAKGGYFVRSSILKAARRPCETMPTLTGISVPTLAHPAGARALGGSGGSSADAVHRMTLLQIGKSPEDLQDHYWRQLIAAGWKPDGEPLENKTTSISRWRSPTNPDVMAVLIVVAWGKDNLRDVMIRVVRPATPRPIPPRPGNFP